MASFAFCFGLLSNNLCFFFLVLFKGITYSVMSASWDEDREGSMLGTEEFSRNLGSISEGLSRSRENALLREKMKYISPDDLAALEKSKKEAAEKKRQQSFDEKLGEELE